MVVTIPLDATVGDTTVDDVGNSGHYRWGRCSSPAIEVSYLVF